MVIGAGRVGRRRYGISLPTARFLVSRSALYVLFLWIGVVKLGIYLLTMTPGFAAVPRQTYLRLEPWRPNPSATEDSLVHSKPLALHIHVAYPPSPPFAFVNVKDSLSPRRRPKMRRAQESLRTRSGQPGQLAGARRDHGCRYITTQPRPQSGNRLVRASDRIMTGPPARLVGDHRVQLASRSCHSLVNGAGSRREVPSPCWADKLLLVGPPWSQGELARCKVGRAL